MASTTATPELPLGRRPARVVQRVDGQIWVYGFMVAQFVCALLLLVPVFFPVRVVLRSAAFGTSLLFFLIVPRRARPVRHPATPWALASILVVTLSAFNPDGGTPLAVGFHWMLYVAIITPLFWAARLELDERTLARLLMIVWGYHSLSSVVGLLQVYFPGTFKPALNQFITERNMLTIRLASGEWVARPSGLSDTPGAAGPSGFYATLCGLGVVLTQPFRGARALGLLSMVCGMMCIYLSQVRVVLVVLGVCFVALALLLMFSGRISALLGASVLGTAVVLASFEFATSVGGDTVINRVGSLVQAAPGTVYEVNRGRILEDDFLNRLPKYPLGAGLGHWGMMNTYFGSREYEIGAELQWGAWILDGGIPLMATYLIAVIVAVFVAVPVALRHPDGRHRAWAAIVAAYNVGTFAICFSYAPFMSALGLEFWLLNAVLVHLSARGMLARQGGVAPTQQTFSNPRGRRLVSTRS